MPLINFVCQTSLANERPSFVRLRAKRGDAREPRGPLLRDLKLKEALLANKNPTSVRLGAKEGDACKRKDLFCKT